jgi:hypothetical protein
MKSTHLVESIRSSSVVRPPLLRSHGSAKDIATTSVASRSCTSPGPSERPLLDGYDADDDNIGTPTGSSQNTVNCKPPDFMSFDQIRPIKLTVFLAQDSHGGFICDSCSREMGRKAARMVIPGLTNVFCKPCYFRATDALKSRVFGPPRGEKSIISPAKHKLQTCSVCSDGLWDKRRRYVHAETKQLICARCHSRGKEASVESQLVGLRSAPDEGCSDKPA